MSETTLDLEERLATFKKAIDGMIATNRNSYTSPRGYNYWQCRYPDYTLEEVLKIINSGDLNSKIRLSRAFFQRNGYYRQIVLYYATMLEYVGILIPNPLKDAKLSNSKLQKRYRAAQNAVDNMNLSKFFSDCAWKSLVDGCYYGLIISETEDTFAVMDLPIEYCRTNYKDLHNNDLIEFNINYFTSIENDEYRKQLLDSYPKFLVKKYTDYIKGKLQNPWVLIPPELGICFPFFDGNPALINVIPAAIEYDESLELQQDKARDEIKKIIVQQVPHLNDGQFLLENPEVVELHRGAVDMLSNNKNVSVLTTYANVEAISSKTTNENDATVLNRYEQNIYSQGGVSKELFASTGSSSIPASQRVALGIMMSLADKFSVFVTNFVNSKFRTPTIDFKYTILPVAYFNEDEYVDNAFKLANSGYSYLLPAIAMGFSQKDFDNVKSLEKDVLGLRDKMEPLQSGYNSTGEGPGRPKKAQDEKSEKTVKNEQATSGESV